MSTLRRMLSEAKKAGSPRRFNLQFWRITELPTITISSPSNTGKSEWVIGDLVEIPKTTYEMLADGEEKQL